MNKTLLAMWAVAGICGAVPASARQVTTSFTSTRGPATTASLVFTASDTLNVRGGYDITGLSGNVNGNAITGIIANPNQPYVAFVPGGFNISNVLYGNGPLLDSDGAIFETANGNRYNIWVNADLSVALGGVSPNGSGGWTSLPVPSGLLTPDSAGPAVQPAGPQAGPTVLTLEDARPYLVNTLYSQGYYFSTPTGGFAGAQGVTSTGANNGTERIVYNVKPLTMMAVNNGSFSLASLDAGTAWYNNVNLQSYAMTLIGTRADGSTVTQTLNLGPSFASYTLNGFTRLKSLVFENSSNGVLSFDNLHLAASVPEPASWAMLLGGFGLVGGTMRSRRKTAASFA